MTSHSLVIIEPLALRNAEPVCVCLKVGLHCSERTKRQIMFRIDNSYIHVEFASCSLCTDMQWLRQATASAAASVAAAAAAAAESASSRNACVDWQTILRQRATVTA